VLITSAWRGCARVLCHCNVVDLTERRTFRPAPRRPSHLPRRAESSSLAGHRCQSIDRLRATSFFGHISTAKLDKKLLCSITADSPQKRGRSSSIRESLSHYTGRLVSPVLSTQPDIAKHDIHPDHASYHGPVHHIVLLREALVEKRKPEIPPGEGRRAVMMMIILSISSSVATKCSVPGEFRTSANHSMEF